MDGNPPSRRARSLSSALSNANEQRQQVSLPLVSQVLM